MRAGHDDAFAGKRSFIFGKSIANQRIEAWWSTLRKECSQYLINVFTQLKDNGIFSADFLDKNLITGRFCFTKLVQSGISYLEIIPLNIYRKEHKQFKGD